MIAFALANWRYLAVAGLLIGFGLWLRSYGHRQCERCRAEVVAVYQVELAKANERARVAEAESRKRVEAVDREYQENLSKLDQSYRDALARIGPIRVRQCPTGGITLSRDPEPASGDNAATSTDGLSRDVSSDLERLLRAADQQTQQLIACQAFVRTLH